MKYLFLTLTLLVLALIQSSFLTANLVVLFCIGLFILGNDKLASISFFASGLLLDLLGNSTFGVFTLSMCLISLTIHLLKRFFGTNLVFLIFLSAFSIFLFNFLPKLPDLTISKTIPSIIFTNLFFLLVLMPFVSFVNSVFKKA